MSATDTQVRLKRSEVKHWGEKVVTWVECGCACGVTTGQSSDKSGQGLERVGVSDGCSCVGLICAHVNQKTAIDSQTHLKSCWHWSQPLGNSLVRGRRAALLMSQGHFIIEEQNNQVNSCWYICLSASRRHCNNRLRFCWFLTWRTRGWIWPALLGYNFYSASFALHRHHEH